MPTGYTADIAKGITFNQFVMDCARAFGALITMRDDPRDAPIPDEFKPESFYYRWVEESKIELARIEAMTPTQRKEAAKKQYEESLKGRDKAIRETNELRKKYSDMLEKVQAWKPPSSDHQELKKFMIEQITQSIQFDCDTEYYEKDVPKLLPTDVWYQKALNQARAGLARNEDSLKAEIERVKARNKWVRELRESLKE